jgi:phosphoribosylformylglycinamidine (FGAM) synthase-like amidotransferase family enzyme
MGGVKDFAAHGRPRPGHLQRLPGSGRVRLVPGALLRNRSLRFAGKLVTSSPSGSTRPSRALATGAPMRVPVAHGEGCYYADEATLDELERRDGQVLFRYVHEDGSPATRSGRPANPNGSLRAIAGVCNSAGNVAGLMPHPERMSEAVLGNDGGMQIVRSLVESAAAWEKAAARPGSKPEAR